MKLMIYLASHDPSASANFARLRNARSGLIRDTKTCLLERQNEQLILLSLRKELFKNITLAERDDVTVEFIAHGNPHVRHEILSMPKDAYREGESNTFMYITPKMLDDFFKKYAYEDGQYKFSEFTLFCCSSIEFGKSLSVLMNDVKITCFNEEIYINEQGEPCSGKNHGVRSTPYVFSNGLGVGLNVSLEDKIDEKVEVNESVVSPGTDYETLSPKSRGNPFARYQGQGFNTYLQKINNDPTHGYNPGAADTSQQQEQEKPSAEDNESPTSPKPKW